MHDVAITYIDDILDMYISKYLADNLTNSLEHSEIRVELEMIHFSADKGYEDLVNDNFVRNSDIIIIDSKLFENDTVKGNKFTGEEFKIILKRIFPYNDVLIVTQNENDLGLDSIKKFSDKKLNYIEYYDNELYPRIYECIKNILVYRRIYEKLEMNQSIEKNLMDKILNSLEGDNTYDELTTNDVDVLVKTFRALERKYDE